MKQRSAFGDFDRPCLVMTAGECAFSCRTVRFLKASLEARRNSRHKRAIAARAVVMNARRPVLAGAGLATNEYRRVRAAVFSMSRFTC